MDAKVFTVAVTVEQMQAVLAAHTANSEFDDAFGNNNQVALDLVLQHEYAAGKTVCNVTSFWDSSTEYELGVLFETAEGWSQEAFFNLRSPAY